MPLEYLYCQYPLEDMFLRLEDPEKASKWSEPEHS